MLTSVGFKRKRYADFFEEMGELARKLWGEDVDLSERSPLGKFVSLIAYTRAEDAETAEEVYNSRFVDTSEGVSLEQNVKRIITRKDWLKATGKVQLTLERGADIPAGTLVSTPYGVQFETLAAVRASEDATYTVDVRAVEFGKIGNVAAGEITKIINPVPGFKAVTNPESFRNGQDRETDEEVKTRYYASLGKSGSRRSESIEARVLDEVEGVRSCKVDENDTMEPNERGVPPKAFETLVLGGNADDIAKKILQAKAGGIRAYGSTIIEVPDAKGKLHKIGFTYAETIPIYVKALIKKGSNYPLDGDQQVKEQIVKFIGGTGASETFNGLNMSENVILARLEAQLFRVEGVEDGRILLSADGVDFVDTNISVGFAQVAETDFSKIEVSDLEG